MAYHAIKDSSFYVNEGEIVGIIGMTGSGKSTLLKLISGQFKPESGVREYSKKISKDGKTLIRGKIGFVFQYPEDQLFEETIFDDVAFGPKQFGVEEEKIEKLVTDSLKFMDFEVENIKMRSPFDLSGGQKRKVAIAGILALDPEIIVMDEPTSGLDPMSKWNFLETLKKLNKSGKTIILVSHDLEAISSISDRVVIISEGKTVESGQPVEIFSKVQKLIDLKIGYHVLNYFLYNLSENGIDVNHEIGTMKEFEEELKRI
jgi:energy-coupling factor transport system ATP-binding protein